MRENITENWFLKFAYFKESISTTANQNENNVPMKSAAEQKNSWYTSNTGIGTIVKTPRSARRAQGAY
jgi:hypothetical protein